MVCQTDAEQTPFPQPVGTAELNLITQSWGWSADTVSWKDPYTGAQLNPPGPFIDPNSGMELPIPIPFGQFYSPANGYPQFEDGDAITLEGLFKWRRENLDPVRDARTTPGYFSPQCGFTGELLLMGGNCNVAFGWYNVTDPNSTTPPAPNEIVQIIPNDPSYLNCLTEDGAPKNDGFCPKAWDTRSPRDLSIHVWTPMPFSSGDIINHPQYLGGYVAFAMIGNPSKGCNQNKHSMYAHNEKNAQGVPWVTTLIYQSTVDPEGFYLMFEDLPMGRDNWRVTGIQGDNSMVDGDFNDIVFFVSGIGCSGGGQPCTTSLQGACSLGRTDCAPEGQTPMCRPIIQPGPEICDNVDNDCDGFVDNGEGLCEPGFVCDKGTCVASCTSGEFPCLPGFTCVEGACVEDACAGVVCEAGQACRQGQCVNACDGVTCPGKQECQLGRCVDPCANVECPAGRVCERGLCVSNCQCRGCEDGLECQADGTCADPACVGVECPAGQSCQLGQCKDLCEGVVCPGGAVCTLGTCGDPNQGTGGTLGSGGTFVIGTGATINFGGSSSEGSGASNSGGPRSRRGAGGDPGCACRVSGSSSPAYVWLAVAAAAGLWTARRRRPKPHGKTLH